VLLNVLLMRVRQHASWRHHTSWTTMHQSMPSSKQAIKWHPDKNAGNAEATERFKSITERFKSITESASRA